MTSMPERPPTRSSVATSCRALCRSDGLSHAIEPEIRRNPKMARQQSAELVVFGVYGGALVAMRRTKKPRERVAAQFKDCHLHRIVGEARAWCTLQRREDFQNLQHTHEVRTCLSTN